MKTKLITYLTTLTAVFALGTVQAAPKKGEAKEDTKTTPAKEEGAKRDTYPLYGKVVSITAKTLTIKGGEGKEDRKYAITADTTFSNGEAKATAADVKPGAWVGGLLKKVPGETNDDLVVKLNVGVKQKEDKADDKAAPKTEPKTEAKTKTKKKAA